MPKTLFERVVFAILMVFIMVLAMEIYNQGQISGGLSWDDVPRAAHESAIMIPNMFCDVVLHSRSGCRENMQ